MTRQMSAPLVQATEIARFRTLAGSMANDSLRYTLAVRTGTGQHEVQCSGCGQGHQAGTFAFQTDATTAAHTHARRCLA
jgi:hypothetical protein